MSQACPMPLLVGQRAAGRSSTLGSRGVESKFYRADEHRAEKVHELFATIARRYDLLNDIMSAGFHRRWKQRLVGLAGAASGDARLGRRRGLV